MNKEELLKLINSKIIDQEVDNCEFKVWVDYAHNWQVELGCINYFLSQILERKVKDGEYCLSIIELIYGLEDELFFRVHECNHVFVEYMLSRLRQPDISLEEELVILHRDLCEYSYEWALRY